MTGAIITIMILVLVGIAWRYAATRKAATTVTAKPKRLLSLTTAHSPQAVVQTLVAMTPESDYTIDSMAEENPRLILSTPPTATTWGFFYPIYLTEQDDRRTLVEVGIQSRLYQTGPLVRQQHEHCFAFIKAALQSDA